MSGKSCLIEYILSFLVVYGKKTISVYKKVKILQGKNFEGQVQRLFILCLPTFDYQNLAIQQHLVIRTAEQ